MADIRWVEVDPDRAPLITWAFEQYATGDWSISRLREALTDKGFTTRSTRKYPGKTLSVNGLHKILTNPYYAGIVPYRGVYHEGDHAAVIDMATWLQVQDVLHAHNGAGEKDRTHPHYLKGSIFCGGCGSRLVFSRSRGKGGVYDHFFCMGRRFKRTDCLRKIVHVAAIEAGVEDYYDRFQLAPKRAAEIRASVRDDLASTREQAAFVAVQAKKQLQEARDERALLLKAHYAGAVPLDMLKTEMDRLVRAISGAEQELHAASASVEDMEAQLHRALLVAGNCARWYREGKPAVRRLMNQGFFTKLYVGPDGSIERVDLTEPFAKLLAAHGAETAQAVPDAAETGWADEPASDAAPAATARLDGPGVTDRTSPAAVLQMILKDDETPGQEVLNRRCSKLITLAEAEGFEPPDPCGSSAFKIYATPFSIVRQRSLRWSTACRERPRMGPAVLESG